ncbi:MAG: hypoxanthine phosphoribosyltransferase [Chlorobiaceae bacterium]|nr:hypoxanthine phosphoribosyltransferase [Chlorobiaceae bacterium]
MTAPPVEKVPKELISADRIHIRVGELGAAITADHAGDPEIVVVCVLKGGFIFAADLVRHIGRPCRIEFIRASSYGNRHTSAGRVALGHDIDFDIAGCHVLLVEDIVDTGQTISRVTDELRKRAPASLKICCLLDKPSARKVTVGIDYTGFTIPGHFVVGYGLDDAEKYRELPFIGIATT